MEILKTEEIKSLKFVHKKISFKVKDFKYQHFYHDKRTEIHIISLRSYFIVVVDECSIKSLICLQLHHYN